METSKFKSLLKQPQIETLVEDLAVKITLSCKTPVIQLVCVLDAAIILVADLMRKIPTPTMLTTAHAQSYVGLARGELTVGLPSTFVASQNDIVIVDTIVDTGHTMQRVKQLINNLAPEVQLFTASLLVREGAQDQVDFYSSVVPTGRFVVGYGLDYAGDYRNLPNIMYKP